MTAPVYRHLDATPTVMGLQFPAEWFLAMSPAVLGLFVKQLLLGVALSAVLYVVFRVATYGKAEGHILHWLLFRVRQLQCGGRYSASARAPQLRFRLAPYPLDPKLQQLHAAATAEVNALALKRRAQNEGRTP